MNANLKNACVAMVAVVTMTACGGSSDDGAGGLSEFQVQPNEVKWKTASTTCDYIKTGEYVIVGGTAPYTVYSPYDPVPGSTGLPEVTFGPPGVATPTNAGTYTVSNRNGRFAIYMQGCFDPAVVTVLDNLHRVATIKVSYEASGVN